MFSWAHPTAFVLRTSNDVKICTGIFADFGCPLCTVYNFVLGFVLLIHLVYFSYASTYTYLIELQMTLLGIGR